jgi:hypothetical protein
VWGGKSWEAGGGDTAAAAAAWAAGSLPCTAHNRDSGSKFPATRSGRRTPVRREHRFPAARARARRPPQGGANLSFPRPTHRSSNSSPHRYLEGRGSEPLSGYPSPGSPCGRLVCLCSGGVMGGRPPSSRAHVRARRHTGSPGGLGGPAATARATYLCRPATGTARVGRGSARRPERARPHCEAAEAEPRRLMDTTGGRRHEAGGWDWVGRCSSCLPPGRPGPGGGPRHAPRSRSGKHTGRTAPSRYATLGLGPSDATEAGPPIQPVFRGCRRKGVGRAGSVAPSPPSKSKSRAGSVAPRPPPLQVQVKLVSQPDRAASARAQGGGAEWGAATAAGAWRWSLCGRDGGGAGSGRRCGRC